ncbi:MAG TPA: autoinducer-2 kinase, partial [Campylobacterales bacterium]|nr:autoinducer-2 kinase [Campylobacterales bacterium]
ILADVTGCKVKVPVVKEATALGAAMAAGVGVGAYDSLLDASDKLVVWDREYVPNVENFEKYQKISTQWEEVYAKQLKMVDDGLVESMWMAPGLKLNR